ncbi:MAG: hypothetical protein AAB609_03440 [Patescibacteria group bacterium]
MNPKTANLDPNLRQAYERVMGTADPTTAAANTPRVSDNIPKPQTQVVTAKNRGRLSPILIVVAVFLFFIIYAIIWTMIFKLKIPFLPF